MTNILLYNNRTKEDLKMSKETARKLITELQTNEELKAKVKGITDPGQLLKIATESGFDVTMEDLVEAEKEYRNTLAKNTDETLSSEDLEAAAGGSFWFGEGASDGHEMGCTACYHGNDWSVENGSYCTSSWFCQHQHYDTRCSGNNDSYGIPE